MRQIIIHARLSSRAEIKRSEASGRYLAMSF